MKKYYKFLFALWAMFIPLFLFTLNYKFVVISGESMERTLLDGDIVLSSKVISLEVGECYMLQEPEGNYYVVKRLVGMPGDHIELRDGILYRNDALLMNATGDSWDNYEWFLGWDEYLFLGDNRAESYDGRHWPRFIHLDEIIYHLERIVYPIHRMGRIGDALLE